MRGMGSRQAWQACNRVCRELPGAAPRAASMSAFWLRGCALPKADSGAAHCKRMGFAAQTRWSRTCRGRVPLVRDKAHDRPWRAHTWAQVSHAGVLSLERSQWFLGDGERPCGVRSSGMRWQMHVCTIRAM